MRVRITRQSKSAMQSGRAKVGKWVIKPELPTARRRDPLTGWRTSGDTLSTFKMRFDSYEAAARFAHKQGWHVIVQETTERTVIPRNYTQNIKALLTSKE